MAKGKKPAKKDSKKWFNNIARIVRYEKNGETKYMLVFGRATDKEGNPKTEDNPFPITINEGDILPAKAVRAKAKRLLAEGVISEEVAERMINGAVAFEMDLPPQEDEEQEEAEETQEEAEEETEKEEKKAPPKKSPPKKNKSDDDEGIDF